MAIDQRAPVIAVSELEVAAEPETVWDLLVAIERWPIWNPDVTSVSVDGAVAEGTTFRWKAGPGTITSTFTRVDPSRVLAWTGKTFGIKASHVYRLEPRNGATLVRTEESWDGLPVRLFRGRMQKRLQSALDAGLQHLQAEAEQKSTSRATSTVSADAG